MTRITPLCLLISCAPAWSEPLEPLSEPGEIVVCVDLPAEQLPAAYDAVKLWDEALRNWRRMRVRESPDASYCDVYVYDDPSTLGLRETTAAWVNGTGGRVVHMVVGRYEWDVAGFLAHELGHAMGAQHVEGTLMSPAMGPWTPRCPDRVTVAQVAAWHRVELGLLRWCE